MLRVATCANTITTIATIQVTTIEFVIGNPNGLAISTAYCDSPWCSGAGSATASAMSEGMLRAIPCLPQHGACHDPATGTGGPILRNPRGRAAARVFVPRGRNCACPPGFRMLSAMPEAVRGGPGRRYLSRVKTSAVQQANLDSGGFRPGVGTRPAMEVHAKPYLQEPPI